MVDAHHPDVSQGNNLRIDSKPIVHLLERSSHAIGKDN